MVLSAALLFFFSFIGLFCFYDTCMKSVSGVREQRLKLVQKQMRQQPLDTHVHFELASFAESKLMEDLVHNILPYADSLGMNEQV